MTAFLSALDHLSPLVTILLGAALYGGGRLVAKRWGGR